MDEIMFDRYGKIISGEDEGYYVYVEKTTALKDNYFLVVGDFDNKIPPINGYDYFIEGQKNLIGLFSENQWKVIWLTDEEDKKLRAHIAKYHYE